MAERAEAYVAIAVGAGVLGAIQPKINAELGNRVGSALVASLVNFTVALVCVSALLAARPATRGRLREVTTWAVPRWTFTAGLGGVFVVVAGAVAVETIGVSIFSIGFFAGQIAFGLAVDRMGLPPGGVRPLTAGRIAAAVLALGAVVVTQAGRPLGEFAPGLVAFVVASGAGVAFQSAFNGRIASATGDPVTATAVNIAVGTAFLGIVVAVLAASGHIGSLRWPAAPWLYAGGAFGMVIVLSLAAATAAVGVLRTTIAMLAAQLITAFVVDWVTEGDTPTAGALGGALVVIVAVALARASRPTSQRTLSSPDGPESLRR